MRINLIYARARNGVIGRENALPWRLPEDLANFKRLTLGCPVIMGRKTWDSMPPKFRPLPGRTNIVVTRQPAWQAVGALRAASVAQALQHCAQMQPAPAEVWVSGGAEIFAQALRHAERAVVTELAQDFEGDTFAPQLGDAWKPAERDEHVSANGLAFAFATYVRRGGQTR